MAGCGRLQTLSIAGYCMPMQFCNASRPSKSVESKRDRPTQKIGVVHQKIRRVICRDGCFHVLRPPENPKPQKYKMTSNRVDSFMNNGNAEFVKGDSVIQLVAPHLSFQQHILYATKGMYATFRGNMNESSAQKQQRKDSAL